METTFTKDEIDIYEGCVYPMGIVHEVYTLCQNDKKKTESVLNAAVYTEANPLWVVEYLREEEFKKTRQKSAELAAIKDGRNEFEK